MNFKDYCNPYRPYFVYFCHSHVSDDITLTKIGFTKSIKQRLRELQSSLSTRIELLSTIVCCSERDARVTEKTLHKVFHQYRLSKKSEWFNLPDSLINFLHTKRFGCGNHEISVRYIEHQGEF